MSEQDVEETPGAERRRRAQGAKSDRLVAAMGGSLDADLPKWADTFIFGEVWGREGLSQDERQLVAIVSLAAGRNITQLRGYLWGALQAGVPASKIHEALVMQVVYVGFPQTLEVLAAWREICEAARAGGIDVDIPAPAAP